MVYDVRVYGLTMFLVDKDLKVALLDMKLAGLRVTDEWPDRYLRWADVFLEVESHHEGALKGCRATIRVCRYKNKVLLCKFYIERRSAAKMVRAVAMASFSPGVLRAIVSKLESMGWRRAFLVEVSRWRRKRSVRSW
ncbi:MAG: hypothetical protein DRJ56_01820 [Thermoprotei archaeon]|nr:MAG: hypothetical protein DRJ56_01820 [Thermoprotei archaeon]